MFGKARGEQPLDEALICGEAAAIRRVVTVEENALMGGFGSAVMETLGDMRITTPVVRVAWPDKFIEHATTPKDLQDKYHVNSATAIASGASPFSPRASAEPPLTRRR